MRGERAQKLQETNKKLSFTQLTVENTKSFEVQRLITQMKRHQDRIRQLKLFVGIQKLIIVGIKKLIIIAIMISVRSPLCPSPVLGAEFPISKYDWSCKVTFRATRHSMCFRLTL